MKLVAFLWVCSLPLPEQWCDGDTTEGVCRLYGETVYLMPYSAYSHLTSCENRSTLPLTKETTSV